MWDVSSGGVLLTFTGHSDDVNSVDWSPDGSKIAYGSGSGFRNYTVMVGIQFLCNLHVVPAFYSQNSIYSGVGRLIQ